MIEPEAKATKITDFEQAIKELQEANKSDLLALYERLCHNASENSREIFLKCRIKEKLEALLSENKLKRTCEKSNRRGGRNKKRKARHSSTGRCENLAVIRELEPSCWALFLENL